MSIEEEIRPEYKNEGTSSRLKEITVFHYLYMRLETQKQVYFTSLRPLIGLDGCHLTTSMGGQLLSTLARDDNDNIFFGQMGYDISVVIYDVN